MSRSWAKGSTTRWRKTRAWVLSTNPGGVCRVDVGQGCPRHGRPCRGVCTGKATTVHHPRGKAAGDWPDNLMPSCAACNLHIGDPLGGMASPRTVTRW